MLQRNGCYKRWGAFSMKINKLVILVLILFIMSSFYISNATGEILCSKSGDAFNYYSKDNGTFNWDYFEDRCLNSVFLEEFICDNNNSLFSEKHLCSLGCSNGACINKGCYIHLVINETRINNISYFSLTDSNIEKGLYDSLVDYYNDDNDKYGFIIEGIYDSNKIDRFVAYSTRNILFAPDFTNESATFYELDSSDFDVWISYIRNYTGISLIDNLTKINFNINFNNLFRQAEELNCSILFINDSFSLCIGEGETMPTDSDLSCCSGLTLNGPKEKTTTISGICTSKCGNGICDTDTESTTNCRQDCAYINCRSNPRLPQCRKKDEIWTCTTEPATCSENGAIQTRTCADTTGNKVAEQISCSSTCSGCQTSDGRCIPISFRFLDSNNILSYCEKDKLSYAQKISNSTCNDNYECESNLCSSGICMDIEGAVEEIKGIKSMIVQILCKLSNLLDSKDYEQCVINYSLL